MLTTLKLNNLLEYYNYQLPQIYIDFLKYSNGYLSINTESISKVYVFMSLLCQSTSIVSIWIENRFSLDLLFIFLKVFVDM